MILGMTPFTFFHVVISLIAIVSGLMILFGMMSGKRLDGWTALFLIMAVATDITGFMFPYHGFTPGIGVGIVSMVVLAIALFARYSRHMAGGWRMIYAITALIAVYLNIFVLVAQLFEHVPSLHVLAPTGSEPPFLIGQVVVMAIFIALAIAAVKGFREQTARIVDRTRAA